MGYQQAPYPQFFELALDDLAGVHPPWCEAPMCLSDMVVDLAEKKSFGTLSLLHEGS
jgi:hypothetical protein